MSADLRIPVAYPISYRGSGCRAVQLVVCGNHHQTHAAVPSYG